LFKHWQFTNAFQAAGKTGSTPADLAEWNQHLKEVTPVMRDLHLFQPYLLLYNWNWWFPRWRHKFKRWVDETQAGFEHRYDDRKANKNGETP